ncbi:PREDICTED: uncharacterized protein LOC109210515 [Nicotiana attenuata]|uniref:uncharacterized protein LOC109210515 n=1 Tax=Nicotiana attenuata TaxID=49451 RepID=UPI0009057F74|nr:PREDICTED: uncharacterized protein LOC109210515 [Nicotiana attenuata]
MVWISTSGSFESRYEARTYVFRIIKPMTPEQTPTPNKIEKILSDRITEGRNIRLPRNKYGKDSIFVVVDGFSRMTRLIPCLKANDALHVDELFVKNIFPWNKVEMMKKTHEHTRPAIEQKNEQDALRRNKGQKYVIFKPGDLVWVLFRKERFPAKRRSKLDPRGDGPFEVLERIGDNAYKLDLPSEHQVSATFNIPDLSLFDATQI